MKILFHSEQLSERGTTTAILEYARYLTNQGHECVIAFQKNHPVNNERIIQMVKKEFDIISYYNFWKIRMSQKYFDVGYFIKAGSDNGQIFPKKPSIVHAVFQEYQPHGDLYLYVSKWLADSMKNRIQKSFHYEKHHCRTLNCKEFQHLDHGIDLAQAKGNLRTKLGIPESATVGVRYGGKETFDIPWVLDAINEILEERSDFYFVFANTNQFIEHPRVKFLDTIVENRFKSEFLNTGDFFLHARKQGESFGLAILEAIKAGIPVIAFSGGSDLNHLNLVPTQLTYSNPESLKSIIYNKEYLEYQNIFAATSNAYSSEQVGAKLVDYISKVI
jgi:glycosyltransferase involved in cell wall biosynthesis